MMEIACFPITIKTSKPIFYYDVRVEMVAGQNRKIVLNKDQADAQDKSFCRQVVRLAFEKSGFFGVDDKLKYVYDGLSCMYATQDFLDQDITVEKDKFTGTLKDAFNKDIIVRVTATASNHELEIHTPPDQMPLDQFNEFKRFLSLVVCQDALDRNRFSVLDHGHLFTTDSKKVIQLNGGIELRQGMSKGIRLVDDGKSVKAAFEVDFGMSAFYRPVTLADTLHGFRNPDEANELLRGARICPDYNLHRSLNFTGFLKDTPASMEFERGDGTKMTVLDYFKNFKKQQIRPQLPLVSVRPKEAGYFPADTVSIIPFQKVRIERLGQKFADTLHLHNAVAPHVRYQHISDIIRDLNLTGQNPILKAFGISVQSSFSNIPASKIWRPAVQMGGTVSQPKDDGSFRVPSKYLVPASVSKWAVFHADRGIRPETVKTLVQRLCSEGTQRGMKLPQPSLIQSVDMGNFMSKAFPSIKDLSGVSYILVIDPKDSNGNTHSLIKLIENRYKIVTQQLDSTLVNRCVEKNQRMTLENILNKINLKLGGVNYAPKFDGEAAPLGLDAGTFVIGYQTAHSKISTERVFTEGKVRIVEPSVLGFTGNYLTNANIFVGNWLYQNIGHELVDPKILEDQMHHVLKLLGSKRPAHAKPKTIVVFRDGISEQNYDNFAGNELQSLKNACARIDANWKPKFILFVTTKEHDTRVFQRDASNRIENPTPGTMIVLRPGKEILAIPQKALKGTAQPVKVTLIKNETSVGFEGIKKFVHALSYTHQLTCSPTGLTEPVYQSEILAQRGLSTLVAFKEHFSTYVPRLPDLQYDIAGLNKRLTMKESRLELIRFTA